MAVAFVRVLAAVPHEVTKDKEDGMGSFHPWFVTMLIVSPTPAPQEVVSQDSGCIFQILLQGPLCTSRT